MKSIENAETRSVRIGPGPGSTLPDTFQLPDVSPAFSTKKGLEKVQLFVKGNAPWKPT